MKVPTTRADPSEGFADGVRQAVREADIDPSQVARVSHATTIATNAVLEGDGARTALICTRGFRYVLEIGRHDGPRRESLFSWTKPARPVPPDRVVEVTERVAPDGTVEVAPDPSELDEIVAWLGRTDVESVAVALIDSFADPANEQAIARHLAAAMPEIPVSVSSDLLPVMREYERSMVAVLNAFVMPKVGGYLGRLRDRSVEAGVVGRLSIMQSNGGLSSSASVETRPVRTMLSGPAAGVIGATHIATAAGSDRLISFDVGGTSTDVALVRDGRPELTEDGRVGPWPVALPMLDLHTIGAGGGSIAIADGLGAISVGPRSAGARPGPACYGLGGIDPTVTDAQLVLGRIPEQLAGGAIRLDAAAAVAAVRDRIAGPLGIDVVEAAHGIVEVLEDSMASAVRVISIERGHDPAGFVLVAGGGAGPLHAVSVARILGIPTVLIPDRPGLMSTTGLLVSRLRQDFVRTHVGRLDLAAAIVLGESFARLDRDADSWFAAEDVPPNAQQRSRSIAVRYPDQPTELSVPWPVDGSTPEAALDRAVAAFEAEHETRYGYRLEGSPIDLVGLRLEAGASVEALPAPPVDRSPKPITAARERLVHLRRGRPPARIPILDRNSLASSDRLAGPAIIEQSDSTTWVPDGAEVTVDTLGNLRIAVGQAAT